MKKLLTIVLIAFPLLLLTACGNNVEKNLTSEEIAQYKESIKKSETDLKEALNLGDGQKAQLLAEIGISYERMGSYDKALSYYKDVLALSPGDYVALNNSVAIYEELEDLKSASDYARQLYNYYKDSPKHQIEVIGDSIRVLAKSGDFVNAQLILNEFAKNYQSDETSPFITDQFEYIARMKKAAEQQ